MTSRHAALVARLTEGLQPVHRSWPPAARVAAWLAVALASVGSAAVFGLRSELGETIRRPGFLLEVAALLGAGASAAFAALTAAVPGRRGVATGAAVAVVLGSVAAALLDRYGAVRVPESAASFVLHGVRCAAAVALFGTLPWLTLVVAARRAAPLDGRRVGRYAGAAALLVGAAAVRIACPIDDALHVAVSHFAPIALGTAASGTLGATWLTRRHWRPVAGRG